MGAALKFKLTEPRPVLRERDVIRQAVDTMALRGWLARKQHVGTFRTKDDRWITIGQRGDPDYLVVHRKYPAFFWEAKALGKRPSPAQLWRHMELNQGYGIPVCVADNLDSLMEWVADHEFAAQSRT